MYGDNAYGGNVLELLPDDRRIERVGFMLGCHGRLWADRHASDMRFLSDRGVTPEEAVRRHAEWYRREVAEHPFFVRTRAEREERWRRRGRP